MSNIRPDLSTADFNAAMTAATQHARGEAEIPVESVPASVNQAIADADSKAVTAGGVAAVASQTARVPDVFNAPVVFVGDSITAGSSGCSRIWGYLQGCGGTLRALDGYNKGVGGDTINMILSRMADIKTAITEGAVVDMQVGTNDITLETGTPEEFKARVVTACREFLKAGAALVVLHPIPAPTARPEGNAVQLPEWLVARTALNEQLASIDLAGVIYETDSASVTMTADDYSDGTHLTLEGALKLGLAQSAWCRRGQRSLMDNLTPGNLLTNPTMSGTGGSLAGAQNPTGDVPDNWTLASPHFAGVVGSKTQDAINTGEEAFTVTIPDAASNGSVVAVRTTVNLPEGTKAGERYVGIIEWKVEAGHTQFRNIDLQAFSQGTRTIEFARSFAPTPGSVEMSGLLTTAFGSEIAAGQTSTTFEVTLRFATGTASGVFHFGKAKFFKVQDSVQAVSDKSAALLAGDESYLPASTVGVIEDARKKLPLNQKSLIAHSLDTMFNVTYQSGDWELNEGGSIFGRNLLSHVRPESGTTNGILSFNIGPEVPREQTNTVAVHMSRDAQESMHVLCSLGYKEATTPFPTPGSADLTVNSNYPLDAGYWYFFHIDSRSYLDDMPAFNILQLRGYNDTSPRVGNINYDCVVFNAGSLPKFVFGFDDANETIYTKAFPILRAAGLVGTIYVPVNYIGQAGRLTWAQIAEMQAAGWGVSLDGTNNDQPMTDRSDAATAAAECVAQMDVLAANGVDSDEMYHMCYPNGTWYGTGTFANGNLQAELKARGMLSGRTVGTSGLPRDFLTTFGFSNNEMVLPGQGLSLSTVSAVSTMIDNVVRNGTTMEFYFHAIEDDPAGWDNETANVGINVYESFLQAMAEKIGFLKDRGLADAMTKGQLYDLVSNTPNIMKQFGRG